MTPSKQAPPLELLQRTRDQVGVILGVVFLLYALVMPQLNLNALLILKQGQWYGVGFSLAFLAAHLLGWFRYALVPFVLYGLLIPVVWYVTYQVALHDLPPASFLLWTTALVPLFFLMLGSRSGGWLVTVLVLGIGIILGFLASSSLVHADAYRLAWMTGIIVIITSSILNFILLRFIEQNLLIQHQTTSQLEAAKLDALTGLPGRASIEDTLKTAMTHARRNKTPLSIVVTDIDHFKQVNDQHGHKMGDEVLQGFSKRLRRSIGSSGVVGRWGGEEFLIVLPGVARQDALAAAEHLRSQVSISPIAGLDITASFGVASYRSAGDDMKALFGRADERLYDAKSAGRNAVR